jgi:hypothetical protein
MSSRFSRTVRVVGAQALLVNGQGLAVEGLGGGVVALGSEEAERSRAPPTTSPRREAGAAVCVRLSRPSRPDV